MFINLLSNAVKFTESGHVHCFVRRSRPGEYISPKLLVQSEHQGSNPATTKMTLSGKEAVVTSNSWQCVQDLLGATAGVPPSELVVVEGEIIRLVVSVEVGKMCEKFCS